MYEDDYEEKPRSNTGLIILLVVIVIVVIVAGYFLYRYISKKTPSPSTKGALSYNFVNNSDVNSSNLILAIQMGQPGQYSYTGAIQSPDPLTSAANQSITITSGTSRFVPNSVVGIFNQSGLNQGVPYATVTLPSNLGSTSTITFNGSSGNYSLAIA